MENITFEAYLGAFQDGRYMLYLDDADINIFEIIGYDKINKIIFERHNLDNIKEYYDQVAYNGEGELSTIGSLYKKFGLYFDMIRNVKINDYIELKIGWWDDHLITGNYDLILKCIEAQKLNAITVEIEVLNLILKNLNTYYQTLEGKIVFQKTITPENFFNFIHNSELYEVKEQNIMLRYHEEYGKDDEDLN